MSESIGTTWLFSLGGTAVATSRGGKVDFKVAGIDVSSKASAWKKLAEGGRKEYTIEASGVLSIAAGGLALLGTLLNGALVTWTCVDSESGASLSGECLCSWSLETPDAAEATYTVTGEGSGELDYSAGSS